MKYTLPLLALLCLSCLPHVGSAAEITVSRADVIAPDSVLRTTALAVRDIAVPARKKDIGAMEEFFAPKVKVFTRSLDPFQPWHRLDDLHRKYLAGAADVMVEQGELEAGMPVPDYRIEAMKQIAALIGEEPVFGTLPDVPGEACIPAAYKVDRKAALAFARKFELDAYSLRFFAEDVFLADRPDSRRGRSVPANTLVMFDYDPKAPEGWGYYETAGGLKGYMKERDDTLGLAQNHVCFARVKGEYRITSVFGYGL